MHENLLNTLYTSIKDEGVVVKFGYQHLQCNWESHIYTTCVCKDAEDIEQNDWTAWPDHSKNRKRMRREITLNYCYLICLTFSLKLMGM